MRQATPEDFDYCATLYFAAMEPTIRALGMDLARHTADFRARWSAAETRIITRGRADIGWLQAAIEGDALFLKQLFVDASLRRQGIGTQVMQLLIDEAARADRAITLGVVKTNPARRLYQRSSPTRTSASSTCGASAAAPCRREAETSSALRAPRVADVVPADVVERLGEAEADTAGILSFDGDRAASDARGRNGRRDVVDDRAVANDQAALRGDHRATGKYHGVRGCGQARGSGDSRYGGDYDFAHDFPSHGPMATLIVAKFGRVRKDVQCATKIIPTRRAGSPGAASGLSGS